MGRVMAGFFGSGWLEISDEGIVVHARRHRYSKNLVGAVVGGVLGMGLAVWIAAQGGEGNYMFAVFAAALGAFVTSVFFRFATPVDATIPWLAIERMTTFNDGCVRVFCRTGGDLHFRPSGRLFETLQQTFYARGLAYQ